MPDWCSNYIKISGQKDEMKKIEKLLFSFKPKCCIFDELQDLFQFPDDMDFYFEVKGYNINSRYNTEYTIEIDFQSKNWPPLDLYSFLEKKNLIY